MSSKTYLDLKIQIDQKIQNHNIRNFLHQINDTILDLANKNANGLSQLQAILDNLNRSGSGDAESQSIKEILQEFQESFQRLCLGIDRAREDFDSLFRLSSSKKKVRMNSIDDLIYLKSSFKIQNGKLPSQLQISTRNFKKVVDSVAWPDTPYFQNIVSNFEEQPEPLKFVLEKSLKVSIQVKPGRTKFQ